MGHRLIGVVILLLTSSAAVAQQPMPLANPPVPGAASDQAPLPEAPGRVFCGQNVTYHVADPETVPEPYRPFIGIWSDAAWTAQLCAALIVENVAPDGTATITYAFGPIGPGNPKPGNPKPGGVLHGTGIIQGGELKFQNSDGSQYGFKRFYADLGGHWTTPKGDTYETIFKKTF